MIGSTESARKDASSGSVADGLDATSVIDAGESLKMWEDELSREYFPTKLLRCRFRFLGILTCLNSGEEGWLPDTSFLNEDGESVEIDSSETSLLES